MDFLQNIKPREYQKNILQTCIKKNCLVVLPTGLGKTLIALMLTIERMTAFPGEKVVFLAPTKPLAEQHIRSFKENLPELFGEMQLFTGEVKSSRRKEIWQTADIIFSTPQCVANDLEKGLYNLKDVCLLVEDEAHRCIKNYDYNFVAKKYKEQATHQRILGLTASPGSESSKIKEICDNLSIEAVELRTRESSDVAPFLQELKFEKVFVDLPEDFLKMKNALLQIFSGYVDELRKRHVLFGFPSKTELISIQKKLMFSISRGNKGFNNLLASSACASAVKIQHAMELLETQTQIGFNNYLRGLFRKATAKESRGVQRLVAKPEFNYVFRKANELIAQGVEHPKILKLMEIIATEKEKNENVKIIVFTQYRETARLISKRINEIPGIKSRVFVGQAKKTHGFSESSNDKKEISGLSQEEQKKIIKEFSSKKTNVLCATSIGEEGLDIPEVNVVVFYEPVPSAIRSIQRAGRTARLMKGKLIILIARKTRDEAHFYVSKIKERKMHSAISSIKNTLDGKETEIQEKLG